MQQLFNKLALNPKRLFLLDGVGALLTAFLLFALLRTFTEQFGMPEPALDLLIIIALGFSVYSFCCFLLVNKVWQPFLLAIIIANLFYCCLTLGLVIYNYSRLTILAVIYFVIEIAIISGLVFIEIKVLDIRNRRKQNDK